MRADSVIAPFFSLLRSDRRKMCKLHLLGFVFLFGCSGSGSAPGDSSTAGTGSSSVEIGAVGTPSEYCESEQSVQCDRSFECAPGLANSQGTLAQCKAALDDCPTYCPRGYDSDLAVTCLTATKNATCSEWTTVAESELCRSACRR
jgi:hypothetical protein